jgi:hypothetical protein
MKVQAQKRVRSLSMQGIELAQEMKRSRSLTGGPLGKGGGHMLTPRVVRGDANHA